MSRASDTKDPGPDPTDPAGVVPNIAVGGSSYLPSPQFEYRGLGVLKVHMIQESELNSLGSASDHERQATNFFFFSAGALLTGILSALASFPVNPVLAAIYIAVMLVMLIATVWYALVWRRAKVARTGLVNEIKSRPSLPQMGEPVGLPRLPPPEKSATVERRKRNRTQP